MSFSFGFELKTLSVFVLIVETGNLTEAAKRTVLSQPSISQILTQLEESLGVELMDRTVRPMAVTTAGRYFYDRAQSILAAAEMTSLEMRQADYKLLLHVKVALVDSIITAVGKPLIDVIKNRTQNWSIVSGQSHLHSHMLLSKQADITISDDPLDDYAGLSRHKILREPFVLVVPNDYTGANDIASVLRKYHLIRYSSGTLIAQKIERYLRRNQLDPASHLQLDNSFAVVAAVASGIGCTITTPLCLFQSGIKQHQVQLLQLEVPLIRDINLVSREHELGDLPAAIAKDCRRILTCNYVEVITATFPWMKNDIKAGD
ncbi:MAG: LysR family transcriptional regulator [Oceanospirillaceae bacterium]|nr:LysR family transcriptional regulator [Oceanospirillaceae bacterium]